MATGSLLVNMQDYYVPHPGCNFDKILLIFSCVYTSLSHHQNLKS